MKKALYTLLIVALFSFISFSCVDSSPSVNSLNHIILYDYENEDEAPIERLGVYIDLKSDPKRIDSMLIYSHEGNFSWHIENPLSVIDNSREITWVGSSNMRPARGATIPEGRYTVTYFDLAQQKVENFFFIEPFPTPDEFDISDFPTERVLLFNESDSVLYYGSDLNLKNKQNAVGQFPDVSYMRSLFLSSDSSRGMLEPAVVFSNGE